MRVLLVQADVATARGISLSLKLSGAAAEHAGTCQDALDMARHYDFDIVLLDLELPGNGGYDALRRMRSARNSPPVLAMSGHDNPPATVKALEMGADGVVSMPFANDELLARMHAIFRRSRGFSQPSLHVGPLRLNLASRAVDVNGQPIFLTGKEYAILELLVLRNGGVLSKDTILSNLYGGADEPEMKIVDVFVCKLRKKLSAAGAGSMLQTAWGRGYALRNPPSAGTWPSDRDTAWPDPELTAAAA
jgi:two-component system cell cycle response regulator CtrA